MIQFSSLDEVGFGIRVEGRDPGIRFLTISDAERGAAKLSERGYKGVLIFDRASGRVVEHVSPHPAHA